MRLHQLCRRLLGLQMKEAAMALWNIASVMSQPEVSIARWRVLEIDAGTRHFVGADERDFSGRVSSAIVAFDYKMLRGRTRSGRVYQLVGLPGHSTNADYVWQHWCAINDVKSFSDVTKQLLAGIADDNRT
ncbi:conserved hypothetical protein [Burkholderia cenocepacia HI2424]|nr:conserved hypothetical protein [Burkholderia cenocepacia HI2424]